MSYKIAAIDIHKRVLMVVVATTSNEVEEPAGAAMEFVCRKFGAGASERQQMVSWLQSQQVCEVVMESTAQYWKPVWLDLEPHFGKLHLAKRNPIGHPRDARTILRTESGWGGACWQAN